MSSKRVIKQLCLVGVYLRLNYLFLTNHFTDPHTSAEAKKHAQSVLDSFMTEEVKNENRVLGGYKATLKSESPLSIDYCLWPKLYIF